MPDGSQRTVSLPEAGIWPHARYHRYQALAYNVAANNEDEFQGLLPSGLGLALVAENQAVDATVKCRGHSMLDWTQTARGDDPDAASLWRRRYAARVWLANGRPMLLKIEERAETAPSADRPAIRSTN